MILLIEILKAMAWIEIRADFEPDWRLVRTLELYKTRGEYDGTLKTSCDCLILAGYEVEKTEWKH